MPYDVGPVPDAAVTASLAARYAAVAGRQGTERCRCAIDAPYCRVQLEADWNPTGLACLQAAAALDATGFEAAVGCLETAIGAFEACHAPLDCLSTAERAACVDTWESAGSACFALASPPAVAGVIGCDPLAADAGP